MYKILVCLGTLAFICYILFGFIIPEHPQQREFLVFSAFGTPLFITLGIFVKKDVELVQGSVGSVVWGILGIITMMIVASILLSITISGNYNYKFNANIASVTFHIVIVGYVVIAWKRLLTLDAKELSKEEVARKPFVYGLVFSILLLVSYYNI